MVLFLTVTQDARTRGVKGIILGGEGSHKVDNVVVGPIGKLHLIFQSPVRLLIYSYVITLILPLGDITHSKLMVLGLILINRTTMLSATPKSQVANRVLSFQVVIGILLSVIQLSTLLSLELDLGILVDLFEV